MSIFKCSLNKKNQVIVLFVIVLAIVVTGLMWKNNTPSFQIPPQANEVSKQSIEARMEEYLDKRYFPRIFDDMGQYIESNPEDPMGYKYLGIALSSAEYYEKSTEQLELALQKNTSNQLSKTDLSKIYSFLGINNYFLKQFDLAISNFNKSLDYDQDNYVSYDGLALVAIAKKDYDQAIQLIRKELDLISDITSDSSAVYAFYHLAKCYVGVNDYIKAKETIDIAQKVSRNLSDPLPPLFVQRINLLKNEIESALEEM